MPDAREIECAVLGNDDPIASIAGEVIPSREFYDYEAKYLDDASRTEIPADLTPAQLAEVQRLSREAFLRDRRRRAWRGSTSCSAAATVSCCSTK